MFSGLLLIMIQSLNPDVTERTTNAQQFETSFTEEGTTTNSLITRILIWDTAIAALKKNPIIGMGLYSFPFAAIDYYTIPRFLFNSYVRGLTPHQTFIAILTETGIIGFIGFSLLLVGILKFLFKAFQKCSDSEQRKRILIINFVQIYILLSMFMTDAWLWGQGLMLFALVLGINIGEYKLSSNRSSS